MLLKTENLGLLLSFLNCTWLYRTLLKYEGKSVVDGGSGTDYQEFLDLLGGESLRILPWCIIKVMYIVTVCYCR